ncbi:MAG: hypothetical protein HY080_04110 [Gammaproteobacteria bacterium]|nr:hypothetical protein [Gammaproteobacteria bacterium]
MTALPIPIQVTPAGISGQDLIILTTALKLLSMEGIHYQLSSDQPLSNAHLIVLDADSDASKQALRQSRPGQVKLVISSRPAMAKNSIGLQRPMDLGSLKQVLRRLYDKLQTQLQAQQLSRQQNEPPSRVEELKGSIFNLLYETKAKQRIVHLLTQGIPDVFIDGINRCLATTATDLQLQQLVRTPIHEIFIDPLNPHSFAVHSTEMAIQSLHNLLWLAGIGCSQGKILPGHAVDIPVKLRAWPNFTRHTFIAEHLKLAAVLAKQAMTLRQLSTVTALPLSDVINFYNAAYAVDLIEFKRPTAAAPSNTAAPSNPEKQSLFAKIAKRLSIKKIF